MSIVAVPIFLEDGWWGFLGADDCGAGRTWGPGEIELLTVVAGAVVADVERQRRMSAEEIIGDRYRSIVEHVPAVTYIDAIDDCGVDAVREPAGRRAARLSAARMDGRRRSLAPGHAS